LRGYVASLLLYVGHIAWTRS